MYRTLYTLPLFACVLALPAFAAAPPDDAAQAQLNAEVARKSAEHTRSEAEAARAQAETARADAQRELEQLRGQMRELSRKMGDLSLRLGDVGPRAYAYRYLGDPDRGMLGVVLAPGKDGVHISAVTPGGPAEKAGIHDGDVLVAIDGKNLQHGSDDKNRDAALDRLHDLKIGQEVKLTVQRDGGKTELNIGIKAERREPFNFAEAFAGADMAPLAQLGKNGPPPRGFDQRAFDRRVHAQVEQAVRHAHVAERAGEQARRSFEHLSWSTPWWGLNLASLNPDLGGYFGTDNGVLVLSADNEALKGLKSGDVLLDVAGQKVVRPEDALRLLREQPVGSEVKMQVLRQHKPLTLSLRVPELKSIFVPPPPPPAPPAPPTMPVPPMPVAPPAPPVPPAPPPPPRDDDGQAI